MVRRAVYGVPSVYNAYRAYQSWILSCSSRLWVRVRIGSLLAAVPRTAWALACILAGLGGSLLWLSRPAQPGAEAQAVIPWQRTLDGLYGDRVVGLAFLGPGGQDGHPMLLLPEDRGLFRSRDDLSGWDARIISPTRPVDVVKAVARATNDATGKTIYAGLRGRPMFARSDDMGETWTSLNGPTGATAPARLDLLAVSANVSGTVYAAEAGSAAAQYWVSQDRGATWLARPSPIANTPITAIFAAPDDPTMYLITGDTLFRSGEVQDTWTRVLGTNTPQGTMQVKVAAAGPRGRLHAAGPAGGGLNTVLTSNNRGDTWPSTGGWPGDTTDSPRVISGGEVAEGVNGIWLGLSNGRVYQTVNNGSSWDNILTLPVRPTLIAVDSVSRAVWVGSEGLGLFRTGDPVFQTGAVSVESLGVVSPGYADDKLVLMLARVQPVSRDANGFPRPALFGLYQSTGGLSWSRRLLTTIELGEELFASPNFTADRLLYSGRQKSQDGGYTWNPVGNGPDGKPPYVVAIGPITNTMPVLYALQEPYRDGSGGQGLLLSEDGGQSWEVTDVAVNNIVAVLAAPDFVENRHAYFATDRGRIFGTGDGVSFEEVSQLPTIAPERVVYDLAASPDFRRDNTLMAAAEIASAQQRAHLFVSKDSGKTWQDRRTGLVLTGRPRALQFSPNFATDRVVFLGTERRDTDPPIATVYGSDSGSNEWYGEVIMPPSAVVHRFAWGGAIPTGRLFAAAGLAGLWWRDLTGKPGPVIPTPSDTPPPTSTVPPSSTPTITPTGTRTPPVSPTSVTPATPTPTPTRTPPEASPTGADRSPTPTAPPTSTPTPSSSTPATPTANHTASPIPSRPPTATRTPIATRTPPKIYLPLAQKKYRFPKR